MALLKLTIKAWKFRKMGIFLSVSTIALGIVLFLSIEKLRLGVKDSFTGMISKTDLVVGARTSPLSLILNSIFHIGNLSKNIDYKTFKQFENNPLVKWAIPISLGDSHKGFRVVGTSKAMFKHFRYRENKQLKFQKGKPFSKLFDTVIGADVAEALKYDLESKVILSHGVSRKSTFDHSNEPFNVTGVLQRTFTPLDRVLLVSLEGIEAIHLDWVNGVPSYKEEKQDFEKYELQIKQVSAFFIGLKSRIQILSLQRKILDFKNEPLSAAIPALVMAEFWKTLSYAESALLIISALVILVSLLSMLISIYSSLNERRREMAIFRAVGTTPKKVFALFLLESTLLTGLGIIVGWSLTYLSLIFLAPMLESSFGIFIKVGAPQLSEIYYIITVFLIGLMIGLLPAYRAYKNSLLDGLTIKI